MRIGFDAKRIFHNFRGLGNYGRTLVEGLQSYYPENRYLLYSPPIKDPRGEAWKKKFEEFDVRFPESSFGKKFPSVWRSLSLSNEISKDNLDIYHGLSHELPPGIDKLKIKSVVTIHDLIYLRHPEFFPWVDRMVYDRKFRYSCEKADLIVAICEQTKRDIIEFFGIDEKRIRVVYQSCMPHFYETLEDKVREDILKIYDVEDNFILYVGAIEDRKNALSLVKAYHKIKDHTDKKLVLIGNGKEYRKKIEFYIEEQNLSNWVRIIDNVSWDLLPAFYQTADLFVYPSFFEGFGIPIIESLVSGTPVITSKGSCFPEAGGPNSMYIDPHNVDELASAMKNILDDEELQNNMIKEGKLYFKQFHQENATQNMMKVYRELLS